jgi:hypothetical protein
LPRHIAEHERKIAQELSRPQPDLGRIAHWATEIRAAIKTIAANFHGPRDHRIFLGKRLGYWAVNDEDFKRIYLHDVPWCSTSHENIHLVETKIQRWASVARGAKRVNCKRCWARLGMTKRLLSF